MAEVKNIKERVKLWRFYISISPATPFKEPKWNPAPRKPFRARQAVGHSPARASRTQDVSELWKLPWARERGLPWEDGVRIRQYLDWPALTFQRLASSFLQDKVTTLATAVRSQATRLHLLTQEVTFFLLLLGVKGRPDRKLMMRRRECG